MTREEYGVRVSIDCNEPMKSWLLEQKDVAPELALYALWAHGRGCKTKAQLLAAIQSDGVRHKQYMDMHGDSSMLKHLKEIAGDMLPRLRAAWVYVSKAV